MRRAGLHLFAWGIAVASTAVAIPATAQGPDAAGPKPVGPCRNSAALHQLCVFNSPEDLADLKGSPWILVSQQDAPPDMSGLAALDTRNDTVIRYKPADLRIEAGKDGDPACAGPPAKLKLGGMGVRREGDGYRMVAINHAPPERIEFYRIHIADSAPRLSWTGCVPTPAPLFLNDIAPLPGGGFAATHMYDRAVAAQDPAAQRAKYLAGTPTGYVIRWKPGAGIQTVAGSEGSFPNGLDVSADGRTLFYAETYGHVVNIMPVAGGARRRVPVAMQPDNVTVAGDGAVLVAGGVGAPITSTQGCPALRSPGCGFPSAALRIDPKSGQVMSLFADDGSTVPGASVALIKDGRLYLGTAFGDRVTEVDLPDAKR